MTLIAHRDVASLAVEILDLTESTAEFHLLVCFEMLLGKDQNRVVEEGPLDDVRHGIP